MKMVVMKNKVMSKVGKKALIAIISKMQLKVMNIKPMKIVMTQNQKNRTIVR